MNSISTIFNKKIIDYVEEGESISQKDIAKVEAELLAELGVSEDYKRSHSSKLTENNSSDKIEYKCNRKAEKIEYFILHGSWDNSWVTIIFCRMCGRTFGPALVQMFIG